MIPDNERGQVAVFAIGMALACVAVVGVAVDGTRALLLRRSLQSAVDAAAIRGASALDEAAVYRGASVAGLDEDVARAQAAQILRQRGVGERFDIGVSRDLVTVVGRGRVDTSFLGLIGIPTIPAAARASAEPVFGEG